MRRIPPKIRKNPYKTNERFVDHLDETYHLPRAEKTTLRRSQLYNPRYEMFNPNFQFRPYELYIITDADGKYALTYEDSSDTIFLSKPDDANKYQWVFIDSDTGDNSSAGPIVFFNATDGHLVVNTKVDEFTVTRGNTMTNSMWSYHGQSEEITLMKYPNYCLCFRKPGTATTPVSVTESFDPNTEPQLLVIKKDKLNNTEFSYKWKWHKVVDLREYIKNAEFDAENKKLLDESSNRADAQNQIIKNYQLRLATETKYFNGMMNGYQNLPGINFLKGVQKFFKGKPDVYLKYDDPNDACKISQEASNIVDNAAKGTGTAPSTTPAATDPKKEGYIPMKVRTMYRRRGLF